MRFLGEEPYLGFILHTPSPRKSLLELESKCVLCAPVSALEKTNDFVDETRPPAIARG